MAAAGLAGLMALSSTPEALAASAVAASGSAANLTVAAEAQPSDRLAGVQPRLSPQQFSGALTAIGLDRGDRTLLMTLFEDYEGRLAEIARGLEEARVAAGRDRYDDAIAGRVMLDRAELAALRRDLARVELEGWGPSVDALAEILELAMLTLAPEFAGRMEVEAAALRRAAFLNVLARPEDPRLVAGESVDLELLVLGASREELAAVPADRLELVLVGWMAAVDPVMESAVRTLREASVERRIARLDRDPDALADADARYIEGWAALHGPFVAAARAIEELAAAADPAAAAAWRSRVRDAAYPWLESGRQRPTLALAWMERQSVGGDVLDQARALHETWIEERTACDDDLVAMVLEARRDHRRLVHPRVDVSLLGGGRPAELFRELLKLTGRAEQLDRGAEEAMADLLEPIQRRKMRADVRAQQFRR